MHQISSNKISSTSNDPCKVKNCNISITRLKQIIYNKIFFKLNREIFIFIKIVIGINMKKFANTFFIGYYLCLYFHSLSNKYTLLLF